MPADLPKPRQCLEERLGWGMTKASQFVPKTTCLTQALGTQVLLGRRGHLTLIHIGVAKGEEGRLEAHAWLESRGKVVLGGLVSFLGEAGWGKSTMSAALHRRGHDVVTDDITAVLGR